MDNRIEKMDTDAALSVSWSYKNLHNCKYNLTEYKTKKKTKTKKRKEEKMKDLIEIKKTFTESTVLIPQICCWKMINSVQVMRKKISFLHNCKSLKSWQLAMETKKIHFIQQVIIYQSKNELLQRHICKQLKQNQVSLNSKKLPMTKKEFPQNSTNWTAKQTNVESFIPVTTKKCNPTKGREKNISYGY